MVIWGTLYNDYYQYLCGVASLNLGLCDMFILQCNFVFYDDQHLFLLLLTFSVLKFLIRECLKVKVLLIKQPVLHFSLSSDLYLTCGVTRWSCLQLLLHIKYISWSQENPEIPEPWKSLPRMEKPRNHH